MQTLRTIQTQNEEEIYFSPILQKLYVYERRNIRVHPDGVDAKPQYEVRAVIAGTRKQSINYRKMKEWMSNDIVLCCLFCWWSLIWSVCCGSYGCGE